MIRLSEDEAWDVLDKSHTGILTTLRRDGTPVSLPVWYVVDERTIVMQDTAADQEGRSRQT